jgi:hypothetical protein
VTCGGRVERTFVDRNQPTLPIASRRRRGVEDSRVRHDPLNCSKRSKHRKAQATSGSERKWRSTPYGIPNDPSASKASARPFFTSARGMIRSFAEARHGRDRI